MSAVGRSLPVRRALFGSIEWPVPAKAAYDFENLIEEAFLAGIIDGETQQLAYLWLANNHPGVH